MESYVDTNDVKLIIDGLAKLVLEVLNTGEDKENSNGQADESSNIL